MDLELLKALKNEDTNIINTNIQEIKEKNNILQQLGLKKTTKIFSIVN